MQKKEEVNKLKITIIVIGLLGIITAIILKDTYPNIEIYAFGVLLLLLIAAELFSRYWIQFHNDVS